MEEYYFLFALAAIWTLFGAVQDVRSREVANWLTFSLIVFALAYRALYASATRDVWFFLFGLLGFGICFLLALAFYYGKVFAGGDAKLLMGFGALLPVSNLANSFAYIVGFIFVLFLAGSVYSIVYSFVLVSRNHKSFGSTFSKLLRQQEKEILIAVAIAAVVLIFLSFSPLGAVSAGFILGMPILYCYLRALEKSCMIKLVDASKLTEGDWLEKEVRIGKYVVRKSVHGLSISDIERLRKARKQVWIKEGIPFVPAFLIALLFMGFFFSIVGPDWVSQLASLF